MWAVKGLRMNNTHDILKPASQHIHRYLTGGIDMKHSHETEKKWLVKPHLPMGQNINKKMHKWKWHVEN